MFLFNATAIRQRKLKEVVTMSDEHMEVERRILSYSRSSCFPALGTSLYPG